MRKLVKVVAFLSILFLCLTSTYAATPDGAVIVNQASLTFIDKHTGQLVEVKSNTSQIVVGALRQYELLSDASVSVFAGEDVFLAHTLTNIGNINDSYQLNVENQISDSGDLLNLLIYVDSNSNGVVDVDESTLDSALALSPGESISLLVTGTTPKELLGEDEIKVSLHAQAVDSNLAVQSNVDVIRIKPIAKIVVELVSEYACDVRLAPRTKFEFGFSASNHTNTLPVERAVTIDGQDRNAVLVEVFLPNGLDLVPVELPELIANIGLPVVMVDGGISEWMSYDDWNGVDRVNRIALVVANTDFIKDRSVGMNFSIEVSEQPSHSDYSLSGRIDLDRDGTADVVSEPACISVIKLDATRELEVRFIEPNVGLQKNGDTPEFSQSDDFADAPVYRLDQNAENANGFPLVRNAALRGVFNDQPADDYRADLNGVFLELYSGVPPAQQIVNAEGLHHAQVTIRSTLTGDVIKVLLQETAPGSNLYRSTRSVSLSSTVAANGAFCPGGVDGLLPSDENYVEDAGGCILKSDYDDVIVVQFIDEASGFEFKDTALVEPISRVFDSSNLRGIPNVVVSVLSDGELELHPITGLPMTVTTDEQGRYTLPRLLPTKNYSIEAQLPSSYVFPSAVSPDKFGTYAVSQASYGSAGFGQAGSGIFSVQEDELPPSIDIPLDPISSNRLLVVEKQVDEVSVDVGETVSYSIKVKNLSDMVLNDVAIFDYPPFGFRYQAGSASYNGEPFPDPTKNTIANNDDSSSLDRSAGSLSFDLPALEANSVGVLRYHMLATAGATNGDGINSAIAHATTLDGLVLTTPTSVAKVKIKREGVLSDKAILFGKVYVDSTCDNIQNKGEWPIAGVRLFMQDGTYVDTDEDGQYSLYGLQPGLHVIKLDTFTMPNGLQLKPTDTNQAADPESRFINLSGGDFHRADFASNCPQADAETVFSDLQRRSKKARNADVLNDADRFNPDANAPAVNARERAATDGDLSKGLLGFPIINDDGNEAVSADAINANPEKIMGDPKVLVKDITEEQGSKGTWLWPQSNISRDGRFMVVVRSGVDPILVVNNVAVQNTKIGEQIINRRARSQLVAWYGVQLVPGLNEVKVKAKDSYGNERVLAEALFQRPTAGVRMSLVAKSETLEADGGKSRLPIDILITDENDNPAHGVYFVTLRSSGGTFEENDLQSKEAGTQVRVENGRKRVHLFSTEATGNVEVNARAGELEAQLDLVQTAAMRPMIASGFAEIGGQWQDASLGEDKRVDLEDGFASDARVALFLKGRIKNDLHLSLAYDSKKNKEVNVLRDLNPNKHYASFGDSSRRGVEAQSRSKLYVKVEKNKNSVMWGDYLTDAHPEHDDLGLVQRTLTGVNSVLENERTRLQVFAAKESSSRNSEELSGNGTAFLYAISRVPIVVNSEIVERIVRDSTNPALIISLQRLQRYADYTIDPNTGQIRFSEIIPTVDSDLNPVSIRVSYDQKSGLDAYWVSGIRVLHKLTPRLSLGASVTDDRSPEKGYTLASGVAVAQLSTNTKFSATSAFQIRRDILKDAHAQRVNLSHNWGGNKDHSTALTWARSSQHFDNPAAGVAQGMEDWKIEHKQPLSGSLKATAEAKFSRSIVELDQSRSISFKFNKSFSDWSLEFGGEHFSRRAALENQEFTTFIVAADKRFAFASGRRGNIGISYEQDIKTSERNRLGLSSRVQLHKRMSAYARYEIERGFAFQSYSLNAGSDHKFTAGIESDVLPSTKLYSEYRLNSAAIGSAVETASGIRGSYEIRPNLSVSPALEIIDALQGTTTEDALSMSLSVNDRRNRNRKTKAQAEFRKTKSSRYFGFRGSVAQRLSVNWTGLLREEYSRQTPVTGEATSRHRMTVGFANRPKLNNQQHSLYMFNWKVDNGPNDGHGRHSYLLSTHQNRQINRHTTVSGRLGARWTTAGFEHGSISSQAVMADVRNTFDIRKRWEVDLRAGWLGAGGGGDGQYSFGVGLAWIAERNVRLGIRYNLVGFKDRDLDEQGFNASGVRIGLQLKFDEGWFKWLE